jgi:hypothetical protein
VPDTPAGAWAPAFPSPELCSVAAALFRSLPAWDGAEGPRRRIVIGPGVVAIREHDPARAERTAERQHLAHVKTADLRGGMAAAEDDPGLLGDDGAGRGRILGWSARSRVRMMERLGQLDYRPLFAAGRLPAVVTFTLPCIDPGCRRCQLGERDAGCTGWQQLAPDAAAWQKLVRKFGKRYARAWGEQLVGVWKREHQRRGAPHLHVFMCPPTGLSRDGRTWAEWFSQTWADVVLGRRQGKVREDMIAFHARPQTCADRVEGMRASDPGRLAAYFTKHGTFKAKAYQDVPPEAWRRCVDCGTVDCQAEGHAGASTGRVWGVWGLEVATATVELPHDEAIECARVMRRWWAARTWRDRTGRVVKTPRRMRGSLGFLATNDGPALASMLAGWLDRRSELLGWSPPAPISELGDRAIGWRLVGAQCRTEYGVRRHGVVGTDRPAGGDPVVHADCDCCERCRRLARAQLAGAVVVARWWGSVRLDIDGAATTLAN